MNESIISDMPLIWEELERKSVEIGFTMPSDKYIGTLLKTLISSKPAGNFLELGTGIGLSLSWMLDGMDSKSKLVSVDNDIQLIEIANQYFGSDERLTLVCEDASKWIKLNDTAKYDLVFADAWPGKYSHLDVVLNMINVGGFYVVDDMTKQFNWPAGHHENVINLVTYLESHDDFNVTKMKWSTGVIIAVRIK